MNKKSIQKIEIVSIMIMRYILSLIETMYMVFMLFLFILLRGQRVVSERSVNRK